MTAHKICRECQSELTCMRLGCRPLQVEYVGAEPDDYPTAARMMALLAFLIRGLLLFFVAGGMAWLLWQVLPILRAVS